VKNQIYRVQRYLLHTGVYEPVLQADLRESNLLPVHEPDFASICLKLIPFFFVRLRQFHSRGNQSSVPSPLPSRQILQFSSQVMIVYLKQYGVLP